MSFLQSCIYIPNLIIYTIKQDIRIYIIYMLPKAGQTAGPNGLKFYVDTQG